MAFPSSPTNGQQTTQNGVVYTYNSTLTAWVLSSSTTGAISASEITSSGNITGANFITAGLITAVGNITGGNISTGGLISATGNITTTANVSGGNIIGTLIGDVIGGNISAVNLVINNISSDDSSFVNIEDGVIVNGAVVAFGNITGENLSTAGLISATGTIFADKITTVSVPLVLNDISTQCDGAKMVFPLKIDQGNITSANITQSKNLQVAVNGLILSPWINVQTWPWFQLFAGFPGQSPGYQVISTATSANITFYTSPAKGSQVVLTIINSSSTAQLRKYPYSATTIVLGD